ncbi:MAG: DUF429 domain-containing protein [Kofleriaceae bacterium]
MQRPVVRFIGLDLGGVRGKTTAIAELAASAQGALVTRVALRAPDGPWTDETLATYLTAQDPATTAIAIDAPLTEHACGRCVRPACPGALACDDPAVVWLRAVNRAELSTVHSSARRANAPSSAVTLRTSADSSGRARLVPYAHRATEVTLVARGLWPVSRLGGANSPIAARARHLARRLSSVGFTLHQSLLEVSPQATITALFGARAARGRKRDADPWRTRAEILARLHDLSFAPSSRLAREEVLRNDHCFDAMISAYTAYCWAREGWTLPDQDADLLRADGWVWAPEPRTPPR